VRLGGGFCSQHAILFNDIARRQGIQSRILGLNGHVVNEALVDGAWRAYDPDYGVAFGASLRDLERDPEKVRETYRRAGRPDEEARKWAAVFASDVDNWHFRTSGTYAPRRALLEPAARLLVWALPAALVLAGVRIGGRIGRRPHRPGCPSGGA